LCDPPPAAKSAAADRKRGHPLPQHAQERARTRAATIDSACDPANFMSDARSARKKTAHASRAMHEPFE